MSKSLDARQRVQRIVDSYLATFQARTDRFLAALLLGRWPILAICALIVWPRLWTEPDATPQIHVPAAFAAGGLMCAALWTLIETALLFWSAGRRRRRLWSIAADRSSLEEQIDDFQERVNRQTAELEAAGELISFLRGAIESGVNQRHRAEEHLRAAKNSADEYASELAGQRLVLRNVIDTIPGCVFWKDAELRYQGCNMAFARLAGVENPDDIAGKTDFDLPWTRAEAERNRRVDRRVIDSMQAQINFEESQRGADGTDRMVLTSKVPLLNADGSVFGLVGLYQDVSDRKDLERQLAQAQKLEAIGQLAAGIAHEINTPMQCVSGNVEFLKNCYAQLFSVVDNYHELLVGPHMEWEQRQEITRRVLRECRFDFMREQVPAAIEVAADAVGRVIEIVRAMKAMSHPGTKEKVSTDLDLLIRNAVTISRNRWKYAAQIQLDLDDSPAIVHVLPAELSQVLLNLIVNAADAIIEKNGEESDVLGEIAIRTEHRDDGVVIEVQDTGCGVPEEIRDRVFDPFFTTKDVGKGTGQGLALAFDIVVNRHGGRIQLESAIGVGTTISIWLPRKPAPSTADGVEGLALAAANE